LPVFESVAALPPTGFPKLAMVQTAESVTVNGDDFTIVFDKTKGTLSSYVFQGLELIKEGPRPDFWRARTDNDLGAAQHKYVSDGWKTAGAEAVVAAAQAKQGADSVMVFFKLKLPKELGEVTTIYAVYGSGEVAVEIKYKKGSKKDLKQLVYRYGTALAMPAGFENITWYGRGGLPTYSDRKFEPVGIYSGTVDGQWIDYSNPQENGNKVDVRWVALQDKKGRGLLFKGVQPLSVGARHFGMEDMEKAPYTFEMTRLDEVLVNIDLAQNGVGGNNSWGAVAMPDYLLPAVDFSYRFHLLPIKAKANELPELGRPLVGAQRTYDVTLPKLEGKLTSVKQKKWNQPVKKKKKKTAAQ
ncbi:MAG: hypothetical protein K9M45_10340, partial [Kiritimatiellales bacterium]|nr:hypothetical protein [Kiritimatiellales bacterium]